MFVFEPTINMQIHKIGKLHDRGEERNNSEWFYSQHFFLFWYSFLCRLLLLPFCCYCFTGKIIDQSLQWLGSNIKITNQIPIQCGKKKRLRSFIFGPSFSFGLTKWNRIVSRQMNNTKLTSHSNRKERKNVRERKLAIERVWANERAQASERMLASKPA